MAGWRSARGFQAAKQGVDQQFGLLLQLAVAGQLCGLLLMGQEVELQFFLHLLQLKQIQLSFIASFLQLLLQGGKAGGILLL
jgi:hypothetical protein